MARTTPYGAFNFLVKLGDQGPDPGQAIGGFSDVSGLGVEITIAEYRNGNEKENHTRKISGTHKITDPTFKRGLIDSDHLYGWIKQTMTEGHVAKRDVVVTLRDEAGVDKQVWTLRGAVPMKWTGPTLAAKGGGDVAMEELSLAVEGIDFEVLG